MAFFLQGWADSNILIGPTQIDMGGGVFGLSNVVEIQAAGRSIALTQDGNLYWGDDTSVPIATNVKCLIPVCQDGHSRAHAYLTNDNELYMISPDSYNHAYNKAIGVPELKFTNVKLYSYYSDRPYHSILYSLDKKLYLANYSYGSRTMYPQEDAPEVDKIIEVVTVCDGSYSLDAYITSTGHLYVKGVYSNLKHSNWTQICSHINNIIGFYTGIGYKVVVLDYYGNLYGFNDNDDSTTTLLRNDVIAFNGTSYAFGYITSDGKYHWNWGNNNYDTNTVSNLELSKSRHSLYANCPGYDPSSGGSSGTNKVDILKIY